MHCIFLLYLLIDKNIICQTYTNVNDIIIYLTHAGFTPICDKKNKIIIPNEHDCLWDRHHFKDPWPIDTKNVVIVHGHTPISSVYDKLDFANKFINKGAEDLPFDPNSSIYVYCGGHKICIDNRAYRTGKTVLFNLDTYEAITFKIGE